MVDVITYLDFLNKRRVGYFSMEIALRSEIPTYAGGLGVLAGDTLRTAADLEIPIVGVTLVSRRGYFRQTIDASGRQVEHADPWNPAEWGATPLPSKVSVSIDGRDVWIGGWLYVVEGLTGGKQPVVLLDTDFPENSGEDREITHFLYGGDRSYRLKQEIVLGVGGVRMLESTGFDIEMYHLNEGHSALLTLQLLRRSARPRERLRAGEESYDFAGVRNKCHFTTHTPIDAGHDRFAYTLVQRMLGDFIDRSTLERLAGHDDLNMTRLALNMSEYVNGVAKRHAETSRRLFPGFSVSAITNGVHPATWTHDALAQLYERELPGWRIEPELLMRADCCLPAEAVWDCHVAAKTQLLDAVRQSCSIELDVGLPTLGYGRRMTKYKRPGLLFSDIPELERIARKHPFQIVLAGKAHPSDESGKRSIEQIHALIRELDGTIKIAFLPNYDMRTALMLVSGVDVWLNTPEPPLEASGTSGMKAALNGVPNLSILDGWWLEGHIEGITGWAIGNGDRESALSDARSLYAKLENTVLPLYTDRVAWIELMRSTISRNASIFHSHRMMRRYAAEAYLR